MASSQVKTAVIGIGRWGKKVAGELDRASCLVAYATRDSGAHRAWALEHIPTAGPRTLEEIADDASISSVAIASPNDTHAPIAELMLSAGKHVFVEKPLATSVEAAGRLSRLAENTRRVLVTGYVLLYHPVYQVIKDCVPPANLRAVELVWKKYGTFTEPIEFSLLTHHLALALDLVGEPLELAVNRRVAGVTDCDVIETAMTYKHFCVRSCIDRLSEERSHTMTFVRADGSALVWKDQQLIERSRTAESVIVEATETPLSIEIQCFVDAVVGKTMPLTAGSFGERVLHLHERLPA